MTPRTTIWTALRKRFPSPQYAYFEELRNGTGWARSRNRTADAVAFSTWPSMGLELHGIEVKVERSDWLREKNDPAKSEDISQFCERWWLATTKGVVLEIGEVPLTWGWLEFDGKKLHQRREAPAREAKTLDKLMVASILRRASENQSGLIKQAIDAQLEERMAEEREAADKQYREASAALNEEIEKRNRARALIHQLASHLGEELFDARMEPVPHIPERLADLIRLWRAADLDATKERLQRIAHELRSAADEARLALRKHGVRTVKDPWRKRRAAGHG